MPGGARAHSGPPPDPNALRRERKNDAGWITLPLERTGETPRWPLPGPVKARERAMWEREWRRPQAVMWERAGQHDEVALYVRTFVEASQPGATANLRTLVKQQQEVLGLSQPGLARMRWRIPEGPGLAPVPISSRSDDDQDRSTARRRFEAIEGG
jgi:hypothetical protein